MSFDNSPIVKTEFIQIRFLIRFFRLFSITRLSEQTESHHCAASVQGQHVNFISDLFNQMTEKVLGAIIIIYLKLGYYLISVFIIFFSLLNTLALSFSRYLLEDQLK